MSKINVAEARELVKKALEEVLANTIESINDQIKKHVEAGKTSELELEPVDKRINRDVFHLLTASGYIVNSISESAKAIVFSIEWYHDTKFGRTIPADATAETGIISCRKSYLIGENVIAEQFTNRLYEIIDNINENIIKASKNGDTFIESEDIEEKFYNNVMFDFLKRGYKVSASDQINRLIIDWSDDDKEEDDPICEFACDISLFF